MDAIGTRVPQDTDTLFFKELHRTTICFYPRKHCHIRWRQVSWLVTFLPSFPPPGRCNEHREEAVDIVGKNG